MSFTNHLVSEVYVINLEKDTKKLDSITKQLDSNMILFERFDAINGKTLSNRTEFTPFCNRFCASGIRGCAFSHFSIWQNMIIKGFEYVMILEDDAVLVENFDAKFQDIYQYIPKDFDILYLGSLFYCDPSQTYNSIVSSKNIQINKHVLQVYGCGGLQGYIISNNCAQKIINEHISFHIDTNLIDWIHKYNLKAYAVQPMLITQNMKNSNLSSNYPLLLNKILHTIPLTDNVKLDWIINENAYQLFNIYFNSLMLAIFLVSLLIPLQYYFIIYIWLFIEFVFSKDLHNTLIYGIIISIPFFIKYNIYKK